MIFVKHKGNFKNVEAVIKGSEKKEFLSNASSYGQMGVDALRLATPKKSGKTADSWIYEIRKNGASVTIGWMNTNVKNGVNIAVLLQNDHATGNGGFVRGIDYINPAMRPVFNSVAEGTWKEVTSQ